MIRLVVADDHLVVRDALAALLEDEADLEVVARAADGEELLARIEQLTPEVAVADVEMPKMTGIEAARQVRDLGLRTAVVLLSVHKEAGFVKAALDGGASGYVLKAAGTGELLTAIRVAAAGDTYLSPRITSTALEALRAPPAEEPSLTPLERDVLRLLARGLASKQMAAELEIGVRTVDEYRARLMDKLGVRHVPGLVKYALRHHLATLDD
jgi:DNA-binding NarL/FixJ family response regulator